jgi:hypothetical protein
MIRPRFPYLDARPGPHLPHIPTGPHPPDPRSFSPSDCGIVGTFPQEYDTAREVELETVQVRAVPYTSSAMVPALIVRCFIQLRWSRWLLRQWNSPVHIPGPDRNDLFTQIELDIAWEPGPTFPMPYLRLAAAPPTAPICLGRVPRRRWPANPRQLVSHPLLHRLVLATGKTPLFRTRIIWKRTSAVFACFPFGFGISLTASSTPHPP